MTPGELLCLVLGLTCLWLGLLGLALAAWAGLRSAGRDLLTTALGRIGRLALIATAAVAGQIAAADRLRDAAGSEVER